MNDTPNTVHWKKGDLVIHDADAKQDDMLMVVIGYDQQGYCMTQYVNSGVHSPQIYYNDISNLHDPNRPDIRARWRENRRSTT